MKPTFKIALKYFLLISIVSVLTSCTRTEENQQKKNETRGYEERIISLHDQVDHLPKYSDPADFFTIYKEAMPLLESNYDTTLKTAGDRLIFIQKLTDIRVYTQALKQISLALISNHIHNAPDSILFKQLLYGKILGLYDQAGNIDSVYSVSKEAIKNSQLHPDKIWYVSSLNNAGFYFEKYGKLDSALQYFFKADSIIESQAEPSEDWYLFQGSVRDNIAGVYMLQNKFEKAREIYAYNFKERYTDTATDIRCKRIKAGIQLANAEISLSNFKEAKKISSMTGYFLDSLAYPDKILIEIDFLKTKIKLFDLTGDIKSAFSASQKLNNLQDSLKARNEDIDKRVIATLAEFTSSQIEDAIEHEKEEKEYFEQRARLRLGILLLIIIGAVVTTIMLIQSHRQKVKILENEKLLTIEKLASEHQKQRLLSLELENKKNDLTGLAISLQHKQQWAKDLNAQMQKVFTERGYKRSRELKKLQDEIKTNVFVDKDLELLQLNIDILSTEFYEKLNLRFPNLTKGEIRLCSYIKLNFNTSQIAHLEHIDMASVKINRYRLKKKLKLSPDQKLDDFIQKFAL